MLRLDEETRLAKAVLSDELDKFIKTVSFDEIEETVDHRVLPAATQLRQLVEQIESVYLPDERADAIFIQQLQTLFWNVEIVFHREFPNRDAFCNQKSTYTAFFDQSRRNQSLSVTYSHLLQEIKELIGDYEENHVYALLMNVVATLNKRPPEFEQAISWLLTLSEYGSNFVSSRNLLAFFSLCRFNETRSELVRELSGSNSEVFRLSTASFTQDHPLQPTTCSDLATHILVFIHRLYSKLEE